MITTVKRTFRDQVIQINMEVYTDLINAALDVME